MIRFLIAAAVLAFVVFTFLVVRRWFMERRSRAELFERVKPLHDKLENKEEITEQDVRPYAEDILTREPTYALLKHYERTELFPEDYYSRIRFAESDLANWLEFPTELGVCPDEIEHVKKVPIFGESEIHYYEVFRFRVGEPHWIADEGWMLGVVGPYFDNSEPSDFPRATFSRLSSEKNGATPEEETKWVHENIYKKVVL